MSKITRKQRLERKSHCEGCGVSIEDAPKSETGIFHGLMLHHVKPVCQGGTDKEGFLTLCYTCHKQIHTINGRVNWKKVNSEVTGYFFYLKSL
jgi:hypothetical protein